MFQHLDAFTDSYCDWQESGRLVACVVLFLPYLFALVAVFVCAAWVERQDEPSSWVTPQRAATPAASSSGKGSVELDAQKPSVWRLDPATIRFLKANGEDIGLVMLFVCCLAVAKQFV